MPAVVARGPLARTAHLQAPEEVVDRGEVDERGDRARRDVACVAELRRADGHLLREAQREREVTVMQRVLEGDVGGVAVPAARRDEDLRDDLLHTVGVVHVASLGGRARGVRAVRVGVHVVEQRVCLVDHAIWRLELGVAPRRAGGGQWALIHDRVGEREAPHVTK
eukprot:1160598-Rhodomonas_salina.2